MGRVAVKRIELSADPRGVKLFASDSKKVASSNFLGRGFPDKFQPPSGANHGPAAGAGIHFSLVEKATGCGTGTMSVGCSKV
jgi:hypothetical protein